MVEASGDPRGPAHVFPKNTPGRPRRIIPVSSGKGGVGKTTLTINYALPLSQHGRTILIGLDTGTWSVRNCIDTPVERGRYHFFKKGYALSLCLTPLAPRLDPPQGVFEFSVS